MAVERAARRRSLAAMRYGTIASMLVGAALSGCATAGSECGRELSRTEIISIVDRELISRYGSAKRPMPTEIEISRSGCDYVYFEKEIPAAPGGWLGVTLDKNGKVIDFTPGA